MVIQEVTGNSGSQETQSAADVNKKNAPSQGNSSTIIEGGKLDKLKTTEPDLYQAMLKTLATNMCNEMKHATERFKKLLREGRS